MYGILGIGLGTAEIPSPLPSLPGAYADSFSLSLEPGQGELILPDIEPPGAVRFPLTTDGGKAQSQGCLLANGVDTGVCLVIAFDTGNGEPWIHNVTSGALPVSNGIVTPGTQIGFAPASGGPEATSLIAGTSPAEQIKVLQTPVSPRVLANSGIGAFLGRVVTYDRVQNYISFAPGD